MFSSFLPPLFCLDDLCMFPPVGGITLNAVIIDARVSTSNDFILPTVSISHQRTFPFEMHSRICTIQTRQTDAWETFFNVYMIQMIRLINCSSETKYTPSSRPLFNQSEFVPNLAIQLTNGRTDKRRPGTCPRYKNQFDS